MTLKLHPNCDELDDKILLLLKEQPNLSQSGIAKVLKEGTDYEVNRRIKGQS